MGTIIEGPVVSNGHTWWNIIYDDGQDGWSAEAYLLGGKASSANANETLLIQSLLQQIRELIILIERLEAQQRKQ